MVDQAPAPSPLNVLFITQDDPFYVPQFFREFVAICQGDAARNVRIKGVVIQAPLGKKSLRALVSQMLGFYGWFDFLRMGIRFAFSKVMNKIAVKLFHGRFPGAFSVEHVLLKAGWPILHTRSVNTPEFREQIAPLQLDLIQSVAASQKFGADLLKAPRYGCINIHNAKLPLNRGMLPNFWSLYNTDREPVSGMTIHLMNEKLDESRQFAARVQESTYSLSVKTSGKARNRGIKKAPFVVLIGARMPSVLVEIGFLTNSNEETQMKKAEYRDKIAEALFKGVSGYADTLSHFNVASVAGVSALSEGN